LIVLGTQNLFEISQHPNVFCTPLLLGDLLLIAKTAEGLAFQAKRDGCYEKPGDAFVQSAVLGLAVCEVQDLVDLYVRANGSALFQELRCGPVISSSTDDLSEAAEQHMPIV
jgi:hypothetical protein